MRTAAAAAAGPPGGGAPTAAAAEAREQALLQQLAGARSLLEISALVEAHPSDLVNGDLAAMALLAAAQMEPGAEAIAEAEAAAGAGEDDAGGAREAAVAEAVEADLETVRARTGRGGLAG